MVFSTTYFDILNLPHISEDSISNIDTTWIELNFYLRGFELGQHFSVLFRQSA